MFHNIKWQALRRGRQGDGETDFALFHPAKGILVIEAKGGEIAIEDGTYVRRHGSGRTESIENPFEQAAACKRQLSDFLAAEVPGLGGGPRVGYAVSFPHVRVTHALGPDGPREIIIDRQDLQPIEASISDLASYWKPPQNLSDAMLSRIRKLLLPSVTVRRLLVDELDDAKDQLVELTGEQFDVLDAIAGNRQAVVFGGAGTGKTLLAVERTRRLSDLGASVLLVCYNELLGRQLAQSFAGDPNVRAGTFHQVARSVCVSAGQLIPERLPADWFASELPARFADAAAEVGFEVDAVVVDEGQDFKSSWWDPLRLVMRDFNDGWFYVFADTQQALYVADWAPPFETAYEYRLTKNCRNTRPIAERVAAVYGGEVRVNRVEGPKPKFHVVKSVDGAVDRILGRLKELIEAGVVPDRIQVLSSTRDIADSLLGRDVDGIGLTTFGDDGIAVETVHRFKGMEAEVVILALMNVTSDVERALAYTGLSRAQSFLEVVGTEQALDAINWASV